MHTLKYALSLSSSTPVDMYHLVMAYCKTHQKIIIFDFETKYFYQNSISSKNGDHHLICRLILHRSLELTFHLDPIVRNHCLLY
jgi:hypothetical protein